MAMSERSRVFIEMKLPAASGRGIKEDNINFIPSP